MSEIRQCQYLDRVVTEKLSARHKIVLKELGDEYPDINAVTSLQRTESKLAISSGEVIRGPERHDHRNHNSSHKVCPLGTEYAMLTIRKLALKVSYRPVYEDRLDESSSSCPLPRESKNKV